MHKATLKDLEIINNSYYTMVLHQDSVIDEKLETIEIQEKRIKVLQKQQEVCLVANVLLGVTVIVIMILKQRRGLKKK